LIQLPNLIERSKPHPISDLAGRILVHVVRKFCRSRKSVRLDILWDRTRKGKTSYISVAQKQTHCEKILRVEFAAACSIALAHILFVNQPREARVGPPQGF